MAAAWAARCGINVRIIEKRGTKIFNGQADGLQCRTLEIFDSFGFADRIMKESNPLVETIYWNPDESGLLRRTDRLPDTVPGISRFQEVTLHQGRIERFYLNLLKEESNIEVERGTLPEVLELDSTASDCQSAYPITVKVRYLDDDEATPAQQGTSVPDGLFRSNLAKDDQDDLLRKSSRRAAVTEIIKAKYVIGCDGAHSWTRRQLGFTMEGEQTDFIWGVLDIVPITDFPDIRSRCQIHGASAGSLMVIPRERKLVRLYIQLKEIEVVEQQVDRSQISPEMILRSAQKILSPYKLTYDYCEWWTAYQIGQRVATHFSANDRIFLAGDAVHTHSPKAGQGMNVSTQDAYNLGWKIGAVVNGLAQRSILKTYETERRPIAQDLIAFDHELSRLFSGSLANDAADLNAKSSDQVKQAYIKGNVFVSGLAVDYGASILVAKPVVSVTSDNGVKAGSDVALGNIIGNQELALNIPLGKRFPSFQVLNQSDARPWQFAHYLRSDGRFRVVLFAGNLTNRAQWERVQRFGEEIASPDAFLARFTPSNKPSDSVIEVLTIHSGPRIDIELLDLHAIFHPFDAKQGWDYDKVFVDDMSYHEGHGEAYRNYGVDRERGCVVIVRPDQYVAWIGELEGVHDIDRYFSGFLIPQV